MTLLKMKNTHMKKINFTSEHRAEMEALATKFLFEGRTFKSALNTPKTVYDLIHDTTLNTLNDMKLRLDSDIRKKENVDEWSMDESTQRYVDNLKEKCKFIHLLIGYKRYLVEEENAATKRLRLQQQIAEMKESTKTPEERIAELEAELATL